MEDDSTRLSRWVQVETGVGVGSLRGLAIAFCFCFITYTSFQELERISLEDLMSLFCSASGAYAETVAQLVYYLGPRRALLYIVQRTVTLLVYVGTYHYLRLGLPSIVLARLSKASIMMGATLSATAELTAA